MQQDTLKDTDKSTYERFILYLYLSAAYADFEIKEAEKDIIREKMEESGLLSPVEFEAHWQKALHDFKTHNDYECEQYIEKTCEELNLDVAAKQKIYDDLKEIMEVEGGEAGPEKMNLFKFKKMLKL
jgi:hypothetical protein